MKNFLYFFLFLFVYTSVFGQKNRYKQVYDSVIIYNSEGNYRKSILLLEKYINQNPSGSNAYLQLALSYEALTKDECNKLILYEKAINSFSKAKKNLTSQNKINKKYYRNIPELTKFDKLTPIIINNFIEKRKNKLEVHYKLLKKECFYRKKSEKSYLAAKRNFFRLKKKFPDYAQLLFSDVNFTSKILDSIKNYYDSTIYFFQQYRIAHQNVNSNTPPAYLLPLKIDDYENFEDTTGIFFSDTVIIYNYKSWAIRIQKILTSKISDIRQKAQIKYATLIRTLTKLQDTSFTDIDPDTLNPAKITAQIEESDPYSLVSALLKYNFLKVKFYFLRNKILSENNIYASFEELTQIYPQIIETIDIIEKRTNKTNYNKYKNFFYKFFGSYSIFKNYPQDEKLFAESGFKKIENIFFKKALFENCPRNDTLNAYNVSIPTKANFQQANTNKTQTLFASKNDKKLFLAGQKNKNNFKIPFFALASNDSIVDFRTLPLPGSYCMFFEQNNNSKLFLIRHKSETIVNFNSKKIQINNGIPVFTKTLNDSTVFIITKDSLKFKTTNLYLKKINFKNQDIQTDTLHCNGFPIYYDIAEKNLFLISDYFDGKKYKNPLLIILKADTRVNYKTYPEISGVCAIKKYAKNKYFILTTSYNELPPYLQTPAAENYHFIDF